MMKRVDALVLLLVLCACRDEAATATPPPPALKAKIIDRMGRAAVNTALNGVLEPPSDKEDKRDTYNASSREAWSSYTSEIASYLAVYDGLDTVCGNGLLAGPTATAGRYDTLAGALALDELWVRSTSGTCSQYFAVELAATNIAPNDDCGGRTLFYDTIDVTYSALAIGAVAGVNDGVDVDDDTPEGAPFPYLAAP